MASWEDNKNQIKGGVKERRGDVRVFCAKGASAVGAGAYGSHGLVARVEDAGLLKLWKTGNQYHLLHSFALLACGFVSPPFSHIAGSLFLSGITLFSGTMYARTLSDNTQKQPLFKGAPPLGGMALIGGWIALACAKLPK